MNRLNRRSIVRLSTPGAELLTIAAADMRGEYHRVSTSGYSYRETLALLREQINETPCSCRDHRAA